MPHNLPISGVKAFVGRDKELGTLHERLQQSGQLNIATIKGMGGIGKSELALQYAYRHRDLGSYPGGLCWLDLRSGDLGGQIVRFARLYLGLTFPDNTSLSEQVTLCWQQKQWPTGEVLLVYNNAGEYREVQPFLPPADPRFRVLITSRNQMGAPVETIEIEVLGETASLELLGALEGKGRVQRQLVDAKDLCLRLGYLPLAIELVGRYLTNKPVSLSEMLERLEDKGLSAKALTEAEVGMTARLGVAAAFELSWQELDEKGQQLCCLLSLFAEALIPWKLLEQCFFVQKPQPIFQRWARAVWQFLSGKTSDRNYRAAAITSEQLEELRDKQLCGLSLLERPEEGKYQLHSLIREYFGQKREQFVGVEELKLGYCRVMVMQARGFPNTPTRQQWESFAPVVPHLAEVAERLLVWVENNDLLWIFVGLGGFYNGQGAYSQAEQWYQRSVDECRGRLGEEHPDTLTSMNNLAQMLYSQGDMPSAAALEIQVLNARRRILGAEHPDTLTSMNNLAATLYAQGNYVRACKLQTQVLEASRRILGAECASTLRAMNNLAATLEAQGDYVRAFQLQEQVLEVHRRLLGEEHLDTLRSMSNLANTLFSQGDYAGARQLQEQVLEVSRRVLGEEHPETLISMSNLANTLSSQGDYAGARQLQEQALEVSRRVLGEEHPETLILINNLAHMLYSQGDYAGARCLGEEVLEVRRHVLGEEHSDTLRSMNNLSVTLSSQGDYAEARQLQEQALEVSRRVLGEEHPSTLRSMNNLSVTLSSQGEYAEARQLQEQALEGYRRVLGEEHPSTLRSMNNLAEMRSSQGACEMAAPLYVEAVEKSPRVLGKEHPLTSIFQQNYRKFLSDIVQNQPDVLTSLLSNGSPMTKQILENVQKDKELGNPTQEG